MGTIHLELSADLQALIDRQIAEGRVADAQSFFTEAAHRYVDDLDDQDDGVSSPAGLDLEEIAELARHGIADIEAGRFITIERQEDAEAWMADVMAGVRTKLTEG